MWPYQTIDIKFQHVHHLVHNRAVMTEVSEMACKSSQFFDPYHTYLHMQLNVYIGMCKFTCIVIRGGEYHQCSSVKIIFTNSLLCSIREICSPRKRVPCGIKHDLQVLIVEIDKYLP